MANRRLNVYIYVWNNGITRNVMEYSWDSECCVHVAKNSKHTDVMWKYIVLNKTHTLFCCSLQRLYYEFWTHRRIADVCFELHFRVTPEQFRPAAASSLHRRLALLATSTRPSFSKNAYLGIMFAPMYQKYSLDFVSFGFYSNIQIV